MVDNEEYILTLIADIPLAVGLHLLRAGIFLLDTRTFTQRTFDARSSAAARRIALATVSHACTTDYKVVVHIREHLIEVSCQIPLVTQCVNLRRHVVITHRRRTVSEYTGLLAQVVTPNHNLLDTVHTLCHVTRRIGRLPPQKGVGNRLRREICRSRITRGRHARRHLHLGRRICTRLGREGAVEQYTAEFAAVAVIRDGECHAPLPLQIAAEGETSQTVHIDKADRYRRTQAVGQLLLAALAQQHR